MRAKFLVLCGLIFSAQLAGSSLAENGHQHVEKPIATSEDTRQIYRDQELFKKKSGNYLAVGLGFSIMRLAMGGPKAGPIQWVLPTPYNPMVFSLKAGTQSFFTKYVGIRGFFGLDMFGDRINYEFKPTSYNSVFTMLSLGIDAIVEFPLSRNDQYFLGFYAGAGLAGEVYWDNNHYRELKNMFIAGGIIVEGGIELTLAIRHRLSLGVKLTPIQKESNAPFIEQTDFLTSLMYSYLF